MGTSAMPAVGEQAPPVEAAMTGGGTFDLANERGRWVAIYFYPRANTPG